MDLVLEWVSVDGLATGAGARGVAALHDEVLHHAVEDGLVVVVLQAQLDEVPGERAREKGEGKGEVASRYVQEGNCVTACVRGRTS